VDSLLRFGAGSELYQFDVSRQISLRDNFRDVVPRTTRLPGVHGGFDDLGWGRAPGEIGNVQVVFWIIRDTPAEMAAALAAVGRMANWGVKRLYKQSMDGTRREMFCEARVNSIDYTQSASNLPHERQRVVVNFQVATPYWYSYPFDVRYMNSGFTMLSGLQMSGYLPQIITGNQQIIVNVAGNAPVLPVIRISSGKFSGTWNFGDAGIFFDGVGLYFDGSTVGTVADVQLRRIDVDTGAITHEIAWDDVIAQDDRLVIDVGGLRVVHEDATQGNVDGYVDLRVTRATWMELMPGVNVIEISGTWTGSIAVFIEYLEAWR